MARSLVVVLILLFVACGESQPSATNPSPTAPGPLSPGGIFTLSGVVYESVPEGRRPLAGVPLDVSAEYQEWPPKVTSDNEGRYSVSLGVGKFKIKAVKQGFSQPCRANIDLTRDSTLDIFVVSDSLLATSGIPWSLPIFEPAITGLVFERTANSAIPVAGARVFIDFTGGSGSAPSANTISDAEGRFLMCNVADVGLGIIGIGANKPPTLFSDFVVLSKPFPHSVDIEVRKR